MWTCTCLYDLVFPSVEVEILKDTSFPSHENDSTKFYPSNEVIAHTSVVVITSLKPRYQHTTHGYVVHLC